ncbi:DNA translocase FtsK [Flaviflagellibacter deserti]|uniref:DNA translocase FtsK n=1 Tax=Flaviflagellibacter deserti TaxID=2267266 RepID=A0ABV9Z611_9HYPH
MRALVYRGGVRSRRAVPDEVRDALGRRALELGGLALLTFAVAATLSLATWSALDPSINNAAEGDVRNLLGRPGAFMSDVFMQTVGLGAIGFLFPVAAWGWRLITHRRLDREKLRLSAWLVATLLAAGFAASFSRPLYWPLPAGLGGIAGDAVFGFASLFLPISLSWLDPLLTSVLGVMAMGGMLLASGIGFRETAPVRPVARKKPTAAPVVEEEDDFDFEEDEGSSFLPLGLVTHYWFTMRAGLARKLRGGSFFQGEKEAGRAGLREVLRRLDEEDDEDPPFVTHRRSEAELDGPVEPIRRIAEPARPPKPGRRLAAEAQTSLFRSEAYEMPPLALLAAPQKKPGSAMVSKEALEQNARLLEGVLEDFGVKGEIIDVRPGPVVTLYELEPAPGIKSSRVVGLADDIARSMSAVSARVAVIPGRNVIGIELPNAKRETVYLRELMASADFENSKMKLPLCLGKTIGGEPVIAELARMPHLLIAGTTGSGKSVAINTMILSLLYRLKPEDCRLIMIDPKMLELSVYDGIPHLLAPVVTDPKKAVVALKWAVREMEERYKKMSKVGVRNVDGFNARVEEAKAKGEVIHRTVQTGFDKQTGEAIYEREEMDLQRLPYIVVIVDEMADLMMVAGKEIEGAIQRLAQMARAAGIHIVMATQRPSVDVITGTIKANFPTRISFQVTSKIDSRTILGEQGAEQLLGQGDMLHMAGGGRISRVHGPFCSDAEVEKVVQHLKAQGAPDYLEAVTTDDEEAEGGDESVFDKGSFGEPGGELFDQAVQIVLRDKKCSTSYIQRRLQIGYNRAASLVERMEREGIVGPANHAGKREILLESDERAQNY